MSGELKPIWQTVGETILRDSEEVQGLVSTLKAVWGFDTVYKDGPEEMKYSDARHIELWKNGGFVLRLYTVAELKVFWYGLQMGCQIGKQDNAAVIEEVNLSLIKMKLRIQELENAQR